MAIPKAIKNNFHALEQAFRNGDIALLECRNSANGEPAYAICAVNFIRHVDAEPEIEMVVSFRQNGVGPNKTCADAILPKGHQLPHNK